ncbi:MAG: hypothetical protein M3463_22240, partial [Verrucomicrobiota bacterium]|nr:hypothetical protein [Verrucomicrobiota bacterium]
SQPAVQVQGSAVTSAPGIYRYESATRTKSFAVNLATEESDLAPLASVTELQGLESKERAGAATINSPRLPEMNAEQQQTLWWWLLAAAGILLLAELAIANRTAL